jgi:ribose/xylose/arabinose/galactoside ABC-type transport system permease subunit
VDLSGLPRLLVTLGIVLVAAGLVLWAAMKLPVLRNLGRLPGDILIERGNTTIFIPVASSILLSILLTIVLTLIFRR